MMSYSAGSTLLSCRASLSVNAASSRMNVVCVLTHLEGLNEGPKQNADGVSLPQQFDEPGRSEQPQETQVNQLVLEEQNKESVKHYIPHR